MRLLLWIALTCALAVEGAMVLPLVAGVLLVGCAEARRRRAPRPPARMRQDLLAG
ncbi:hypothetical protein LZG04_20595 [Saccharothrix sp. S26]|uniref:hypothetical protein n=1 Tax=Saccharothrix sp. S26 TaxID=2907215 RepID=UPI001F1BC5AC|nr:hypothetical protein [Saccharothrix sp. S26]MCE6997183.1 hypothetical protein [Saccharothrix sp. S26]